MDFSSMQIQNDPMAKELVQKFNLCETLIEVNLSFNGLGDAECLAIAKAIRESRTIRRLFLFNNNIHAKGAQSLAFALMPNAGQGDPTLEELSLRNNSVGAEGAQSLALVFSCNKRLKKMDLYWNNIRNIGLQAILMNIPAAPLPADFRLVSQPLLLLHANQCHPRPPSPSCRTYDTTTSTGSTRASTGRTWRSDCTSLASSTPTRSPRPSGSSSAGRPRRAAPPTPLSLFLWPAPLYIPGISQVYTMAGRPRRAAPPPPQSPFPWPAPPLQSDIPTFATRIALAGGTGDQPPHPANARHQGLSWQRTYQATPCQGARRDSPHPRAGRRASLSPRGEKQPPPTASSRRSGPCAGAHPSTGCAV